MFLVSDKVKAVVQWEEATPEEYENGIRIVLNHFKEIKQVKKMFTNLKICIAPMKYIKIKMLKRPKLLTINCYWTLELIIIFLIFNILPFIKYFFGIYSYFNIFY